MHTLRHALIAAALAGGIALAGCESTPSGEGSAAVIETPDSLAAIETYSTNAIVTSIDAANRKITLRTPDGRSTVVKAGPAVVNFAYIKVNDQVTATVTEEFAVLLSAGGEPLSMGASSTVALAPVGARPGAYIVDSAQATARVEGVDPRARKLKLLFADGSIKTIRVGRNIDLSNVLPGNNVTVQIAESMAIEVH